MKNLSTPFTLSLLIVLSVACTSKSTEDHSGLENADNPEMHETTPSDTPTVTASTVAFKDEATTQIFNAYLAMKDALVENDVEKVSAEAAKLEALLDDEKYNSIKVDAENIAKSTDPTSQRESFVSLSDQLTELAKKSELTAGDLFLQHCPMANGNKGANWLSLSEKIRNPYFGDKMLKCGSVTEKIY